MIFKISNDEEIIKQITIYINIGTIGTINFSTKIKTFSSSSKKLFTNKWDEKYNLKANFVYYNLNFGGSTERLILVTMYLILETRINIDLIPLEVSEYQYNKLEQNAEILSSAFDVSYSEWIQLNGSGGNFLPRHKKQFQQIVNKLLCDDICH